MPVKEMTNVADAPTSIRKRIMSDSAPELMETPLPLHTNLPSGADETSKRRMPESLKRFLIRVQGGKFYLPAAYRIVWFRDECPDWGISTSLVEGGFEAGFATVKAEIYNPEGRLIASDYKTESKQDFPAGWVEKASTGAIARALSLTGFGTQFAPELDEDGFRPADGPRNPSSKFPTRNGVTSYSGNGNGNGSAARMREEIVPRRATGEIWEGPDQCPTCHAPEGKPHGKQCAGVETA